MASQPDDSIRRYLLGLLPDAEASALEEAYLADADALERVRAVEDDLLDDYAAGRLEASDKAAFERRYLASPPLRERVATARALRAAAAARGGQAVVTPPRWRIPLGIAAGLFAVGLALWVVARPPSPSTTASLPAASATPAPVAPSLTPGPTPSARASLPSRAAVFALSPVLLRGQERSARFVIPDGTDEVELELEGDRATVPPSAPALDVVITTVEGKQVWQGTAKRPRDGGRPSLLAAARVPAAGLPAGDYLLTLSVPGDADGTLSRYFFRVGR